MKKHIKYPLLALFLLVLFLPLVSCTRSEVSIVFTVDGESYSTVTAYTGEEVIMPEDPVKDEHVFDGWFLDSGRWSIPFNKNFFIGKEYSSDLYVYAKWAYVHTHTAGDFIISTPSTCSEEGVRIKNCIYCGETLETDVAPLLPHTEVIVPGYAATETNDGLTDGSYCSVCNDIIASQNQIPALIQGTELRSELFEIDGSSISLLLSNSVTEISILENLKTNYKATVSVSYDIHGNQPTEDTVSLSEGDNIFYITVTNGDGSKVYELTVQRRPSYTLTFISGEDNVAEITVEEDSLASAPDVSLNKLGYTFGGWNYDFEIPVTEEATVSAIWIPNQNTPYTVEHYVINSDGNISLYRTENHVGTTDSPVTAEFIEIENHVFVEENSTPSGNIAADGSLVLKLYYKTTFLTVRFDTGCEEKIDELTTTKNSVIEAPREIAFGDLEFMGWFLGDKLWDFDTDTVTESITLSAKWGYRVTFILEGVESSILVEKGKTFKSSDAPKKKNAAIEWYILGTDELWKYTMPVTKAVTLVAKVYMEII